MREVRKIAPNLGLHELGNSRDFCFQLRFAKEQAEDILLNLDNLIKNTIDKVPMRKGNFCLDREKNPLLTDEEDKWERAIYRKWGPKGRGEYVSVCKSIQAYQYPLYASQKKDKWGAIDLLGIGMDFLPVPNELKKREPVESPLRMLVEVAAYGFAIQKVWPKLKDDWGKLSWFKGSPPPFPATLDKVTLVGVAPEEYWRQCLGQLPGTKKWKFPDGAWPSFWKLVDAFGKWFDIHFVSIDGSWDDAEQLPKITGARVFELRSLTLKPPADTSESGNSSGALSRVQ